MQKASSGERDDATHPIRDLVNLRVTHRDVAPSEFDRYIIRDQREVLKELAGSDSVHGVVVLQTCNRVEFFAVRSCDDGCGAEEAIEEAWAAATGSDPMVIRNTCTRSLREEAVRHLMEVASGVDSQITGEEQILGQVHEGLATSRMAGAAGEDLRFVFDYCIRAARRIRAETRIGKGSASVGSIAVDLLEERCGRLAGRRVLVIGAGQMGKLVARKLVARGCTDVTIANRTIARAEKAAGRLGIGTVDLESIDAAMSDADAVVVATAAPHHIITGRRMESLQRKRGRHLVMVDISRPRNVEESVGGLSGVTLLDFGHIEELARDTFAPKATEVEAARDMIEQELSRLRVLMQRRRVEPIVSAVHSRAERLRMEETERAKRLLKDLITDRLDEEERDHCEAIVDAFSRALVSKMLVDPVQRARQDAERGDIRSAELLARLFDDDEEGGANRCFRRQG